MFTLIELLVVVAIVAVLVAVLLPSLAEARYLAKTMTCLNNYRQIGNGLNRYAMDFTGVLPPFDQGCISGNVYCSWSLTLVYGGYIWVEYPSTLVCPICHPVLQVDWNNRRVHDRSYVYNDWVWISGAEHDKPLKLDELQYSASTVLVTEWPGKDDLDLPYVNPDPNRGLWWNSGWGHVLFVWPQSPTATRYLVPAHREKVGVLCADSHVETVGFWESDRFQYIPYPGWRP